MNVNLTNNPLGCLSPTPLEGGFVHAVGLELGDLFERTVETHRTPRPTWEQRELMKMRRWKAVRPDFLIEASVLLSAAGQIHREYPLSEEDRVRMLRAGRLFRSAMDFLK